ncbi:telomere repeat-binding protein 3-like [Rutidosis leptorrhynchoides]|uniref:telomere repeat-binding protein 3-like n=1 Tax=Rutidosis leptorrhynchoides TaxID=125765 RepID=UPI003A9A1840
MQSSENGNLCAFELLADVAEKLLQETESSTSSVNVPIVKQEESEVKVKVNPMESLESDNDSGLEHVSDFVKKAESNVKLEGYEGENGGKLKVVENQNGKLTFIDSCVNTRVLDRPFSGVDLPLYKNCVNTGNVKMDITDDDDDDDDKFFRFDRRLTKMRAFRSRSRLGYRRMRKMLTSRYQKLTAKKDCQLANPTSGLKPCYQNRKNIYKREMCQMNAPSKRRKLFHHSNSNVSDKVRFSVKSFEVPELYVEIPETATVGSLKRTVMEAVRAYLGGELHVGILLEGKKVKDNNRTLQQTGISLDSNLETLGFTLEPCLSELSLPNETSQPPSSHTVSPTMNVGYSNQEIIPLQTEVLTEERVADNKALVPVPPLKDGSHSLQAIDHKSKRRIRRPFSVSEVEALVEAVETLGTGRWCNIKMRAFADANHRTYVDLKDKWKTLVHTANIAPQQRRGAPVPQYLLDRVLAAHEYWSNHQPTKLKRNHQSEPLQVLEDSRVEFVGI